MGYYLNAFICRQPDASVFTQAFKNAVSVDLPQGISLIPVTGELYDEINNFADSRHTDDWLEEKNH